MQQYLNLVDHVMNNGVLKENRTGVDTLSTFGYYYEHDLRNGFPLLTTKKMSWKNIVVELIWFLSGSNKIEFLHRHNVHFWDSWANSDGLVNSPYNQAWRGFETPNGNVDQISWAINRLINKPMSRDIVVSAWQPHIAHNPPNETVYWNPCHCMFIMNVQMEPRVKIESMAKPIDFNNGKCHVEYGKRLCLHLTQRSADVLVGIPFNLASYALLNHLFARFANLEPGIFGHTLIDAHIYTNMYKTFTHPELDEFDHIPVAMEQIKRKPRELPKLNLSDDIVTLNDVEKLLHPSVTTKEIMDKFALEGYNPHPALQLKAAI